ncbi:MAG: blue (type 1) copper domain protein [Thermoleophilia bacterium]|nr:blue (type 1) copper domain protein [Thermoleophilia bacterium]
MIARFTTLLLVLLAAVMFAACGGDDDSSSDDSTSSSKSTESTTEDTGGGDDAAAGGNKLELGVDGNNLKFDKEELTASAGSVTLTLNNTSTIPHNVGIEDKDGKSLGEGEIVGDGETSTVTVDLKPGEYTYYCSPHKSSGMTGKLTVS